jgi:hypothetical protein
MAGSCVREPAWSIAAVRDADEPIVNPPVSPERMFAPPNAIRSRFALTR